MEKGRKESFVRIKYHLGNTELAFIYINVRIGSIFGLQATDNGFK